MDSIAIGWPSAVSVQVNRDQGVAGTVHYHGARDAIPPFLVTMNYQYNHFPSDGENVASMFIDNLLSTLAQPLGRP